MKKSWLVEKALKHVQFQDILISFALKCNVQNTGGNIINLGLSVSFTRLQISNFCTFKYFGQDGGQADSSSLLSPFFH